MNVVFNRKIESFKRVLNGDTYQSIAKDNQLSVTTVRCNVVDIFWLIRLGINIDQKEAKRYGSSDIILARSHKEFWMDNLQKAMTLKDEREQAEELIRAAVNNSLSNGCHKYHITAILSKIYKEIK